MLHQSTPFCWHFTSPEHQGMLVRHSRSGDFQLCHQTLEQAVAAAKDHFLVTA